MVISEYAQIHGLSNDTALMHLVMFDLVEATGLDEPRQQRLFQTLVRAVNAGKFAAAIRKLAKEIVDLPCPARQQEFDT